jgi:phosphoribosylglycinamide formyltransferase-1
MSGVVVLISGRGSNMEAMVHAGLPVAAVISNKPGARGLAIAQAQGIPTAAVNPDHYPDRDSFDAALAGEIDRFHPDLVVLAGFMRILTDGFVARYHGRLLNIHPSLLPALTGLNTHARALAEGLKLHGCTVHYVTPTLDRGPIVVQAEVPVREDDTPDSLANRVLEQEHRIYPQAVRWFLEGRLSLSPQGTVRLAGARTPDASIINPALTG